VSKSSRAVERPPPPPGTSALRPKWRLPITCICPVAVSTSSPRSDIIASSSFHELFGRSSSNPSSTAASATSLPFGGAVPSGRRTAIVAVTFSRTLYTLCAGATFTDDIVPFEDRKLWLLNGGHSLLAYAGSVRGHRTVADAVADETCRSWLREWWSEASPYVDLTDEELAAYRAAFFDVSEKSVGTKNVFILIVCCCKEKKNQTCS